MSSTATNANSYIMNKYCWMSRQLRNFNDSNSIIQWANAMLSVKNLLLQPQEADVPLSTILPTNSANTLSNANHTITLSRTGSLSFPPVPEPRQTLSRTWTCNFQPQPPSPLTIFTPSEHSIPPYTPPSDSNNLPSKKRKVILPPEVDYNASAFLQPRTTEENCPTTTAPKVPTITNARPPTHAITTTKIAPGTHIWYGYLHKTNKAFWAYRKFAGSEEYKILQETREPNESFNVMKLTTGETFNILLTGPRRMLI